MAALALACGPGLDTTWHTEGGYRWRALDVPRRGTPGFSLLDGGRTGITFTNAVSESLLVENRILAQGAGVCLGDADGDGLTDVFLARTEGANALYRNLGGWRFDEVTEHAGVGAPDRFASGCAFADVDGDGDVDLLLSAIGGPNALFRNDGSGVFTEETDEAGLASSAGSATIAVGDVDGDGDLDLYVVNYKAYTTLDRFPPQALRFDRVTRQLGPNQYEVREPFQNEYRLVDRAELGGISLVQRADPDFFYLNDGAGRFVREPIAGNPRFLDEDGRVFSEEPEDFGLSAVLADLSGDGAPDLYVVNDFEDPDLFWLNDGHGTFRLVPRTAVRATSNSGMAVDVADVNRDGEPDLLEVDMLSQDTRRLKTQIPTHTAVAMQPGPGGNRPQRQRNTLQLNRGDGTYAEIARLAGVGASGWSWSTLVLDVDLDGWEDVLVGTGHLWDVMDGDTQYRLRDRIGEIDWRRMLFEFPPLPLANVAFRNRGDLTFEDVSRAWRFDLGDDVSHAMAVGDLDGDGDLDMVINRLRAPAAVLRNDATAQRVAVRLRGHAPNTRGIGSTVRVLGGAVPSQQREVTAGGLYLSSSEPLLTFATGPAAEVTIEVDWRDGGRTTIAGAVPNRLYEIEQSSSQPVSRDLTPPAPPSFEDVTEQLGGHRHTEPFYDDYARQLLLPNALSQLGPGVAWDDVDGDGDEDLIVGSGESGTLALFRNSGGRLTPAAPTRFPPAVGDLTAVLGWPDGSSGRVVLAGVSSYETTTTSQALSVPSVVAYSPATGAMTELVGGDTASVGPLALGDYDGDGDLDLFVGGRVFPGGYPLSPSSRLYRNEAGRLVPDAEHNRLLQAVGMVSAALFSDLDGDGWPELLIAIEWGTIRVFSNQRGRFQPAADLPGLSGRYSRWNGLATGDLDADGRLDILATSWGRNTGYSATEGRPLLLYAGFFEHARPIGVLAQHDPRIGDVAPLASLERLGPAFPNAARRLGTFGAYADATMDQIIGPAARGTLRLGATTLDHTVFLNRGDRFEVRPLPLEAQLAPAFYAGIADFDGDGNEDVFLSQNFFGTDVGTPRYDAGRSLLLLGDGTGALAAMAGERSGLVVYGEQRGAAYADFDADGRLDLAVSQNGAATRLFRNVGAVPGLRVRLIGAPTNPTAVGAQMRVRYAELAGAVREIQAGSGYWSQNGAVQVVGRSPEPTALWIRWPGGSEQVVPLEPGQREITVRLPSREP